MGKTKGWVERAHKTGNWASHETKARQELTKSGAWIRALRKTRQPGRYESEREDLRSRTTLEAAPAEDDLRPEEYVESGLEEHDEDELPDGEGSVVAEPDDASVVTLSLAYDAYQAHGGNRRIPDRVLAELGEVPSRNSTGRRSLQ
jgi:hypothetical protein